MLHTLFHKLNLFIQSDRLSQGLYLLAITTRIAHENRRSSSENRAWWRLLRHKTHPHHYLDFFPLLHHSCNLQVVDNNKAESSIIMTRSFRASPIWWRADFPQRVGLSHVSCNDRSLRPQSESFSHKTFQNLCTNRLINSWERSIIDQNRGKWVNHRLEVHRHHETIQHF